MEPQDDRDESSGSQVKAPYQRPELKRIGRLRDVTAVTATIGAGDG